MQTTTIVDIYYYNNKLYTDNTVVAFVDQTLKPKYKFLPGWEFNVQFNYKI